MKKRLEISESKMDRLDVWGQVSQGIIDSRWNTLQSDK